MSENTWCTHVVETADIGEIMILLDHMLGVL